MERTLAEHWRKRGFLRVHFKQGDPVPLDITETDSFWRDWQGGRAFGIYKHMYGSRVYVRLADVKALQECTPESIAAEDADDEIDEQLRKEKELRG